MRLFYGIDPINRRNLCNKSCWRSWVVWGANHGFPPPRKGSTMVSCTSWFPEFLKFDWSSNLTPKHHGAMAIGTWESIPQRESWAHGLLASTLVRIPSGHPLWRWKITQRNGGFKRKSCIQSGAPKIAKLVYI